MEWETQPPVAIGSRIAFVAHFLGRRIAYTYEVTELVVAGTSASAEHHQH